ncbi:MAG TPA: hypothetical protein VGP55_12380 [Chitinophagaceae bacterium]|nr:hypothetical protein [Chitinophagaceae bacterium]
MRQNIYIRKLFAFSLLLIFALSITPTKVLHFVFANHKDANVNNTKTSKTPIVSVAGYNCRCDNLVVTSPFTFQHQSISVEIPEIYPLRKAETVPTFHVINHFFFELRGPPSLA